MSPYSTSAPGFQASAGSIVRFMGVSTLGAVTPTNLTVAPDAGRRRSRSRVRVRLVGRPGPAARASAGYVERRAQAGDVEDLARRRLEGPQLELAPTLPGALERPHEDPEPRRVDELHAAEIDHDPLRAAIDESVQLVTDGGGGRDIDLPLDGDRHRARVIANGDAKVLSRRYVGTRRNHDGEVTQPLPPGNQLEPHDVAIAIRVVPPPIGECVHDVQAAPVGPVGVERAQLDAAPARVPNLDMHAVVGAADRDARRRVREAIRVRDQLAREERHALHELVRAAPTAQRAGHEAAGARGARRDRGKHGGHLAHRLRPHAGFAPLLWGPTGRRAHALASDRNVSKLRARRRETCIWLTPTRSAISDWVMPSKNRSSTTLRSRSGSTPRRSSSSDRCSICSNAGSSSPRHATSSFASSSSRVAGASSDTRRYSEPASMASRTSSSETRARSATSAGVGDRPCSWPSVATIRPSWRWSSCTRRGTRTAHPRSRKWRLSSPRIVGVANVENCRPRPGSKRSTALSRPTSATWTRSSTGSPRFANRRARKCASGACSSTSSSRRRRSRVRR